MPEETTEAAPLWTPGMTIRGIQERAVNDALIYFKGNKTHAARGLRVCIRTLRNWINRSPRLKETWGPTNT